MVVGVSIVGEEEKFLLIGTKPPTFVCNCLLSAEQAILDNKCKNVALTGNIFLAIHGK